MHADLNCYWPVDLRFPTVFGLGAFPKSDDQFCRSGRAASRYLYVAALHVVRLPVGAPSYSESHHSVLAETVLNRAA
jgi:hypothetical protein